MKDYKEISEYWNTQKPSSNEREKLLWSFIKAAIEKQIPKKPTMEYFAEYESKYLCCPNCKEILTDRIPGYPKTFYFHCLNCGQKLDWESITTLLCGGGGRMSEWIVGNLVQTPFVGTVRSWISSEIEDKERLRSIATYKAKWRSIEVRSDTICQCTGLKDKNGTLIWENDICVYDDRAKFVVKFGEYNEFINKSHIGFYAKWEDKWVGLYRKDAGWWSDFAEVIGSCFDNPELLEVGWRWNSVNTCNT